MQLNPGLKDVVVGTVTVTGPLTDAQLRASAVLTTDASGTYAIRIDDAGSSLTYVGQAAAGSSAASAVWRIKRMDDSASPDLTILWADGVSTFTKVWNDRATYTYS